jgi:hypothetical protein
MSKQSNVEQLHCVTCKIASIFHYRTMWRNRVWKSSNEAMLLNCEMFISTFVQVGIARSKGHSLLKVRVFLKIEFGV